MKAIVCETYGRPDVLQLKEVASPTPKDNEVLIAVHAVSLNQYDWHCLTADIFLVRFMGGGLLRPKFPILGQDVAGRIAAVGRDVTQFRPGDEVFGDIAGCGNGGLAEYTCAPPKRLVLKPANLSFEEAAAVPMAAVTALQGLRDVGRIAAGQRVLIQGAAGGVGTFAVQLARWFGAEVTAVCSSRNLEQARALGATHLIDYAEHDFTRSGKQYDLILGVNGYHSLSDYRRALVPKGRYVMAGGQPSQIFESMLLGPFFSGRNGKKLGGVSARANQKDLSMLGELLVSGHIKPVIDQRFPLSEAAEAMRYLGSGHARGKVVVSISPGDAGRKSPVAPSE